jgi:hypothetical protein
MTMCEFKEPKIIVSAHKPSFVPLDNTYIPVQAGAINHNDSFIRYRDNDGINISAKNKFYSELTTLYWFWKNCYAPYVGLSHYRRYFKGLQGTPFITAKDISNLGDFDIVLPNKRNYYFISVKEQFESRFSRKYWSVIEESVNFISTDSYKDLQVISSNKKPHIYNMFIMKWSLFDEYMSWLFDVLKKSEELLSIDEKSNEHLRMLGHFSERLLDVWLYPRYKKLKIKELDVYYMESQPEFSKAFRLLFDYLKYKINI